MTKVDTRTFQLGQIVHVAKAEHWNRVEVPCAVCFGKLSVELILGNGEHTFDKGVCVEVEELLAEVERLRAALERSHDRS